MIRSERRLQMCGCSGPLCYERSYQGCHVQVELDKWIPAQLSKQQAACTDLISLSIAIVIVIKNYVDSEWMD